MKKVFVLNRCFRPDSYTYTYESNPEKVFASEAAAKEAGEEMMKIIKKKTPYEAECTWYEIVPCEMEEG